MDIDFDELLLKLRSGEIARGGSIEHMGMHILAQEALKIISELNGSYHEPEEIRAIFSRLIGKNVDSGFTLFPPFYTECGRNIFLGKNVFINFGCHFQDQGGIYIGDNVLIGSQTVIATINHGISPKERSDNFPQPVKIGNGVWIGSKVTILPGVTIGDNAVIGAGSVVTKDVESNIVALGAPAKKVKSIPDFDL